MIRYHKISPQDTLKKSLPEIVMYLEEGWEEVKGQLQMHVDLKCAIMNAPNFHKKDEKPYEWKDFLPKELLPEKQKPQKLTPEEKAERWAAAGAAWCDSLDPYKNGLKRLPSEGKKQ